MNRYLKRILIGVMALTAVTTGLEGCASPSYNKAQAAKALREKYGEEFEITDYKPAGLLQDFYSVQAYAAEHPDLPFQATVDTETGEIADAYVTKCLCSRISEKISMNLQALNCEYYVYTEAELDGTVLTDPEVLLEDYMKEGPGNRFTVYLCVDEKGAAKERLAAASAGMLSGISGLNGTLCLYLTDDEMMKDIQDYVTSHDRVYEDFEDMTEKAYVGYVDFENSGLVLTETTLEKMAGDRL